MGTGAFTRAGHLRRQAADSAAHRDALASALRRQVHNSADRPRRRSEAEVRSPAEGTATRTILVVDDNPDVADILTVWFNQQGFDVAVATCAFEAFELLRQLPIDAIVLDLSLPDTNAVVLGEAIRSAHPRIPLVACSSGKQDDPSGLENLGGCVVYKPLQLEPLTDLLRRLIPAV